MKQARFWAYLPVLCMVAMPLLGQSRNELKLGNAVAKVGTNANVPLTISTTDQVQGLVGAFEWDASKGTGTGFTKGPTLDNAPSHEVDIFQVRVESNYAVVGIVMDTDGTGNEVINPGTDILIGTVAIKCGLDEGTTAVTFADGKYAVFEGSPLLDNIVVIGGLSVGSTEGLILTPGSFTCVSIVNKYYIAPGASNTQGRCGDAKVLMDNKGPVEGYVVALCHDSSALDLTGIDVGAAAAAQAADFISTPELSPSGGTFGVVIDLVAPFTNNTIPAGEGNHIATYHYCCKTLPTGCGQQTTSALTFCDNVLGTPLKENVMVIGGLSVSPALENGTFACKAVGVPEVCGDGIDNDCDGVIDNPELCAPAGQMFACGARKQAADGTPGPIQGSIGSPVEVCFFYKSPEDNKPGHAQPDHIQGFSMALTYCCDISAREVFDISGTIVEAVGADFVSIQADNDPTDGDGCELILGVLVDALPPFDGATLPPTGTFQRVGCVPFDIKNDQALCGKCCPIAFTDGVNGRGKVPIKNLISVENVSVSPQRMNCEVCVVGKEKFFRGDCNFSRMGSMSVDIADAAAVVSFLFLPGSWKFQPPCLDACDCNDDGRIDLADAVCILQFLFQFGRFPPAPGPGIRLNDQPNPNMVEETPPGEDPTPDKLDCKAGSSCV
jgi:hypothetical protein